ncbi:MAG: SEC-C metal-binding domain-containing protein, partial [Acidobacteriota bacterium]
VFAIDGDALSFENMSADEIRDTIWAAALKFYEDKEQLVGRDVLQRVERDIMLQIVDAKWEDHLYSLDHLKEGIGLRGYGQRDPLVEYKKESFGLFQAMKERVDEEIVRYLWWLRPMPTEDAAAPAPPSRPAPRRPPLILNNPSAETPSVFGGGARAAQPAAAPQRGAPPAPPRTGGDDAPVATVRRDEPKVGRNDPCPCGSGKKYKKCHGAAA